MGYTYSFVDNQTYGTDDINAAFGRLLQSGVGFYSGNTNLVAGMNETQAEYASAGVNIGGCRAEIVEPGAVKIHAGWALFEDGSTITIDAAGVELPYTQGAVNYVYLKRDTARNNAEPAVSQTAGGENTVPLAKISDKGVLTDMRVFAVTKLIPNSANLFVTHQTPQFTLSTKTRGEDVLYTIDAGGSWVEYILINKVNDELSMNRFIKLTEGIKTEFLKPNSESNADSSALAFQKRGQYIDIYAKFRSVGTGYYKYEFIIC